MPPSTSDRLRDIADTIEKIDRATRGMTRDGFAENEVVRAATERYLGIVCEASLRLPAEMKQQHGADINWRAMNDFANILRHGYHSVDVSQVWIIVHDDLPKLRAFTAMASRHRERD